MPSSSLINFSQGMYIFQAVLTPDNWMRIDKCDVLLCCDIGHCGYTYRGKAYAPLLNSVSDLFIKCGLKTSFIFTPFSKLRGINTYSPKISYNRFALSTAIASRMFKLVLGTTKSNDWSFRRRAYLWNRILSLAKPRYVIGIHPDPGLCHAGKLKGIRIYDFQHGVIDDRHTWYGQDYCCNKKTENLVDGFLCWDEPSASVLRKWAPQKGIEVKVVGNPWFSRFALAKKNDVLVQEALDGNQIFRNGRPVVLVSLQWGMMSKTGRFNGVVDKALRKTILETADQFNWLLRLHPIQMRGSEKIISHRDLVSTFGHLDTVEWQHASELPLPVVLKQTDLHITDSSTVVVEAAWMGIRSALLNADICPGGALESYYSYERNIGLAEVIPSETNALKQWILDTYKKGKGYPTMSDASNALHEFIEDIAFTLQKNKNLS